MPPDVFTHSADPAQFRTNVSKITHKLVKFKVITILTTPADNPLIEGFAVLVNK